MTTTVLPKTTVLSNFSFSNLSNSSKTTSLTLFTPVISAIALAVLVIGATVSLTATTAMASDDHHDHHETENSHNIPFNESQPLKPASRYSGSTPIDLSHGLLMNNGTYGEPNPNYVSWSTSPTIAVNISEKTYPYSEQADFCRNLTERLAFFEAAIWNWNQVSPATKPEAIEYAKNAVQVVTPKLDTALASLKKAKGAGQANWNQTQADARRSFLDLQATYYQLHRNPTLK